MSEQYSMFVKYFEDLILFYGENMPDASACHKDCRHLKDGDPKKVVRELIYLHCGLFLSKHAVYEDFVKHSILLPKSVALATFKQWWADEYWHVKVILCRLS